MLGKTSTPTDCSPRAFAPGFSLYSLSRVALASRSMVALLAANETVEAAILIARVTAETAKNNLSIALGILNWLRLQLNFIIILLTIHNLRRSSIRDLARHRVSLLNQRHSRRELIAQHNPVFVFDLQVARRLFGRQRCQHLRSKSAATVALVLIERYPFVQKLLGFQIGRALV